MPRIEDRNRSFQSAGLYALGTGPVVGASRESDLQRSPLRARRGIRRLGPDIPHRAEMRSFDVAPTVLDLMGLAPDSNMQRASVNAATASSG
jgi:hypothetical protein